MLRAAVGSFSDHIFVKDTKSRFVLANIALARHMGAENPEELLGKTDFAFYPKKLAAKFSADERTIIESGRPRINREEAGMDQAGNWMWFLSTKVPLRDSKGKTVGIVGSSRDITWNKRAEEALRDSRALYYSLVESLPVNVFRKDLAGKFSFGNRLFCETLGKPLEEIIGKTDFDLFPKELAEKYRGDDKAVGETREVFEDIEEHQKPDGERIYVEVLKAPVYNSRGEVVGIQGIFWDVTEKKRAEEELKRTAAELTRSNAELEQFAYIASHDLQEPLRMVASYTQLLAKRYKNKLDSDADDFIEYVVDGASRMRVLIDDLLTYSRIGTHGRPFEPTDCEEVLERVFANLQMAIHESGAIVTHNHLPTVTADPSQLEQLLQNLIRNAIKFHSEEPPRVHVSAEENATEWLFSVRDNGIGIDPEYANRIFVIFQRLHGRGEYPGTGIGLAVCKKIVQRHGGRIWVESQPGKGSTFYFTIPNAGDQ